jgi:integrase
VPNVFRIAGKIVDLKNLDSRTIEALVALAKAVSGDASVIPSAAIVRTFADLWEPYQEWGKANLAGWRTVQGIHGPKHLLPFWGPKPWTDCGFTAADQYVAKRKRARSQRGNRLISPATINREMATVKALFNWTLRRPELGVKHNPLSRYPDLPEREDRKFALTEEEFVSLLEHSRPLLRLMLIIALETGMRRDEFRLLVWPEVDLKMGLVRLPAERTKARRARDIPLSDLAVKVLEQARTPGSDWVFASPHSAKPKPVPKSTLGQWFAEARTDAGVKGPKKQPIWIHTIRKTSVTEKLLAGMDLQRNMDMHGHCSKEVHDEYRVLTPEYLQGTRDVLNRRRGPKAAERPTVPVPAEPPPADHESPLMKFVSALTG